MSNKSCNGNYSIKCSSNTFVLFWKVFYWCTVHLNNIIEKTNTNLLIKILFYRFPSDNQIQHEFKKSKSEIFFLSINSIIILNSIECKCAFERIIRLDGIKSLLLGPPHTCLLVLQYALIWVITYWCKKFSRSLMIVCVPFRLKLISTTRWSLFGN
jgi:hypothetical protein